MLKRFSFLCGLLTLLAIAGGAQAQTLTRSTTGLLYQTDFAAATGWTLGTGWTTDALAPTFCTFDPTPLTFEYTVGGLLNDSGGAREFHPFIDTDGTWYLFYGAGDSTGPSNPWRIHLAKSADRGLTWTKLGPLNIALSDGAGGTVAAADMLYMEKIGTTYNLHAMTAGTLSPNGVPGVPYQTRLWTNTACTTTGWVFANTLVSTNSIGGIDTSDETSGNVVGSTTAGTALGTAVYHLFTSVRTTGGIYGVGHLTSTSRTSGFVAATNSNPVTMPSNMGGENPKVFWSTALGKWVMFLTTFFQSPGNVFRQSAYTSTDLSTWTPNSGATAIMQRQSPLHGNIAGANILSPVFAVGGSPVQDSFGYVPCSYDNDPSGILDIINSGRHGRFVVAEPALNSLHYTPTSSTLFADNFNTYVANSNMAGQGGWVQAVGTSGSIVATGTQVNLGSAAGDTSIVNTNTSTTNSAVQADITIVTNASVGFILRYTSNTSFYLIDFSTFNSAVGIVMYKGGTAYTQVGATFAGGANTWVSGTTHTCKVVPNGSSFACYLDGVLQVTFTDAAIAGAGTMGLRNGQGGTGTRLADNFSVSSSTTSPATAYRALAHSDFVAEYSATFPTAGTGAVGFDFHVQANGDGQRLMLTQGGKLSLQRIVSGVATTLPLATGSVTTGSGFQHYIRVQSQSGKVSAWLDGEQQISYTDAAFASGVTMGFYADGGSEARVRAFHIRASSTVTINGLTAGHTIVPRTPGGLPIASFVVPSSGVVSFSYPHFPLGMITDNGTDYTPGTGSGLIWGGDSFGSNGGTATTIIRRRIN